MNVPPITMYSTLSMEWPNCFNYRYRYMYMERRYTYFYISVTMTIAILNKI